MTDSEKEAISRWLRMVENRLSEIGISGSREEFTTSGDLALDSQVANILLQDVQDRLPDWGLVEQDGVVTTGRRHALRTERIVTLMPQLLFQVNWTDSGPGFSWPESYYVTYVPEFDVGIVTASQDGEEIWGHTDLAIGFCASDGTNWSGTEDIVCGWWRRAKGEGSPGGECPMPWEELLSSGLIPQRRAEQWRDWVWPPTSTDPVDEDDELDD